MGLVYCTYIIGALRSDKDDATSDSVARELATPTYKQRQSETEHIVRRIQARPNRNVRTRFLTPFAPLSFPPGRLIGLAISPFTSTPFCVSINMQFVTAKSFYEKHNFCNFIQFSKLWFFQQIFLFRKTLYFSYFCIYCLLLFTRFLKSFFEQIFCQCVN